jgi:hypothetical protein
MHTKTNTEPKRHHFVPRFYLRHFSDRKKRVRMYARGAKKKRIVTSVNNAAVESGFYTIVEEMGDQSQRVEHLLSMIEGLAKAAIGRMLKGRFPPDIEDRSNLSLFLALQTLRTPEHRRSFEAMVDYSQKVMLEGWTPDYACQRLKAEGIDPTDKAIAEIMDVVDNPDKYRFVPHQNEHIKIMLDVATRVAPVIAERSWLLGHSRRAAFVTSDHPVVWRSETTEMSKYMGVGVGNAEEEYFPLDRRHVLTMALPDAQPDGMTMELIEDNVLFVNSLEAAYSHKWVYQHPDDDPIDDLIPDKPRPLMEINQEPIFED